MNILDSVFAANPAYELVLFDRLPAEQRELLKDLQKDSGFYGVLRPIEKSNLGVKAISRDTALLFLTLRQPGQLPEYARKLMGELCNQEISRLVLDGVLALQRAGRMISGSEAAALIGGDTDQLPGDFAAAGFLERLSFEALKYGQSLGLADRMALSMRLYGYNRAPLSPYWKRILRDDDAVIEFLRIRSGRNRELLDREWVDTAAGNEGWLTWQSRRPESRGSFGSRIATGPKLYVSPKVDHVPDALPLVLNVFSRTRVRQFKIGKGAAGLLRPDKLVAYFSRQDDLTETAEALKRELNGCAPHGVPFTSALTDDGLLSWGVDPPADGQVLPWVGLESWRLWVTNRLAAALIAARSDDSSSIEPWRFALQRLQLEGVDTRSWMPGDTERT